MKVYPNDVLEVIKHDGPIKKREVARILKCGVSTISKRVRQLLEDREHILFSRNGYEHVGTVDEDNAPLVRQNERWLIGTMKRLAVHGHDMKPLLIQARKVLTSDMTKDERKILKSHLLMIGRLIEAVEVDEELNG